MILDEVINGTLDQGRNCMIIYEDPESNEMFETAIDTFKNLDGVVDSLYEKTQNYKKTYLFIIYPHVSAINLCKSIG